MLGDCAPPNSGWSGSPGRGQSCGAAAAPSWYSCGASYVVMSGAGLPCVLRATAQLVYVRLHGPDPSALYAGSYSDDDLHWWADRIRDWDRQGRDVLAYFNN